MNVQRPIGSQHPELVSCDSFNYGKISVNCMRHPAWLRAICFTLLLGISWCASGQRSYDWRTNVDLIVERADSLSLRSQNIFHQNRIIKVDKSFRNDVTVNETWYYTISEGKVIIFQIRYLLDSTEYMETYYLNNGNLVCLEQYESDYYSPEDEINWGKVLFFDNNIVKLNVSVGHRKSREESSYTSYEAIEQFNKRYTQLLRNLRVKARG